MKCTPCRVTFEGFRYQISADGTVHGVRGALRNEPTLKGAIYDDPVIDANHAKLVRAEAARQRRNRNARERNEVMRDLGMKKTPYGWE